MQAIWKYSCRTGFRNLRSRDEFQYMLTCIATSRYIHSSTVASQPAASSEEVATTAKTEDFLEPETKHKELSQEEVLKIRNKSRLKPHQFELINSEKPFPDEGLWYRNTTKFRRRLYAKMGEASGVNPGIQWPTHDELKRRLEYESVAYPVEFTSTAYPLTLQEMMDRAKEKRRIEKEYIDNRTKEIEAKVALIDKVIKEVHDKRAQKEREVLKAQEKKAKMMEEVRRHFGYTMDPRDERFQELLEKKEKEEKKRSKDAKKMERERQMIERLQQKSAAAMQGKSKQKPKDTETEED